MEVVPFHVCIALHETLRQESRVLFVCLQVLSIVRFRLESNVEEGARVRGVKK